MKIPPPSFLKLSSTKREKEVDNRLLSLPDREKKSSLRGSVLHCLNFWRGGLTLFSLALLQKWLPNCVHASWEVAPSLLLNIRGEHCTSPFLSISTSYAMQYFDFFLILHASLSLHHLSIVQQYSWSPPCPSPNASDWGCERKMPKCRKMHGHCWSTTNLTCQNLPWSLQNVSKKEFVWQKLRHKRWDEKKKSGKRRKWLLFAMMETSDDKLSLLRHRNGPQIHLLEKILLQFAKFAILKVNTQRHIDSISE